MRLISTKCGRVEETKMENRPNERKEARGFLKTVLMSIPNFLKLLVRLFKDPRVPLPEKALVVGTIVYVISPLDFIPDMIPFVGQIDDLYLIALVLLRLLHRTSDEVLVEHWDGTEDLVGLVEKIEKAALYILPKRIQQVLIGRVEIAPKIESGLISPPTPESIGSIEDRGRRKNTGRL